MRQVNLLDETLRDGEQTRGVHFSPTDKLRIANLLVTAGTQVINGGFPAAGVPESQCVQHLARNLKGAELLAIARCTQPDIDACWQAIGEAESPRIGLFIPVSDLHMRVKLNRTPQQIVELATSAVRAALKYTSHVDLAFEDATRAEPQFLVEVARAVAEAGASVLTICDTVGYSVPESIAQLVRVVRQAVDEYSGTEIGVHCHNDLGLAVANTLAAAAAGAARLECTVNGLGERAGNASLEQVVTALAIHTSTYGVETRFRLDCAARLSTLVAERSGVEVAPSQPVVGRNAFSHVAGIHQDGVMKNPGTYEVIDPAALGRTREVATFSKLMGRSGLHALLREEGLSVPGEKVDEVLTQVKAKAAEGLPIHLPTIVREVTEPPPLLRALRFNTDLYRWRHEDDETILLYRLGGEQIVFLRGRSRAAFLDAARGEVRDTQVVEALREKQIFAEEG